MHSAKQILVAYINLQLLEGVAFQHDTSTTALNVNYTKNLPTALFTSLRQAIFDKHRVLFSQIRIFLNGRIFYSAWRQAQSFASFAFSVARGLLNCVRRLSRSLASC
jgi:hypothetical protein